MIKLIKKLLDFLVKNSDKILHVFVSMVVMLFITALFSLITTFGYAALIGAAVTMTCGIGKEIYDKHNSSGHSAEWGDILADFIGVVLTLIPLLLIQL